VHQPLRELLRRTLGVEPELRRRLGALEGLDSAAIFGSWAANRVTPYSDIDVLVVGDVDRDALLDAVRPIERLAGREISVTAYRPEELARRQRDGSGFLTTILSRTLIPLVGQLPGNGTAT
jgi:predicted nucleotidyltransferase